ncbi:MAG TPA: cupredoxin domain-containing protein [Solirubrobacteraceae bacterium]|jgi:uncharacterized cupredoxin-like copper-binding protein|nr:cupredoxin domain-containing protein [Solirubrobacteraceae bacterium]
MLALPAAVTPIVPVGVAESEWHLSAYRPSVRRGRLSFHVHNYGMDPHDLAVRGPRGYRSAASAIVEPGGDGILKVTLRRPGRYTLYCTLPGHASRGMRTTLVVR